VCLAAFRFFDCVPINERTSVVSSQPSVACSSSDYTALRPLVIAIIAVLVVAAPVAMLLLLVRARRANKFIDADFIHRWGML
jgi:hypothetical protein